MFLWEEVVSCSFVHSHTRCTYSQCMPRVHSMTFEPTGNTHALLLVDMQHGGYVQQSVKRMAKRMLKSFRKQAKFQAHHQMWGYGCFSRQPFITSANHCSLVLINLTEDFTEKWLHFGFLYGFRFRVSLPAPSSLLSSQFFAILTSQQWDR